MLYVSNAFSLSMLSREGPTYAAFPIPVNMARDLIIASGGWESTVGHADTAALFSSILGFAIPVNRVSIKLNPDNNDCVLVGQYIGPRLPEGTTILPE